MEIKKGIKYYTDEEKGIYVLDGKIYPTDINNEDREECLRRFEIIKSLTEEEINMGEDDQYLDDEG